MERAETILFTVSHVATENLEVCTILCWSEIIYFRLDCRAYHKMQMYQLAWVSWSY